MKRRQFLKTTMAGMAMGTVGGFHEAFGSVLKQGTIDTVVKKSSGIRGPFPILSTPYLESGAVDYEVLAKEAQFIGECQCPGLIWPQSGDSCDLLSMEEKLKGMEAIAKAMAGSKSTVTFGCQGKNTEEMILCAEHADKLAMQYEVPVAVISRPPDDGKTEDDLKAYYLELERHVNCPAIIQTSGGVAYKGPEISVELLIELAKHNPKVFGYIKEESGNCNERMEREIKAKPIVHTVFSAWGSWQWLYQGRQIGTEGLISERPAYADLLMYIWKRMENNDADGTLDDAFSKYLLMLNTKEFVPGNDMRGPHLYILQKRGIFKNRLSREYAYKDGKAIIPSEIILKDQALSQQQIEEIESRFVRLSPYLKE